MTSSKVPAVIPVVAMGFDSLMIFATNSRCSLAICSWALSRKI